MRARPMDGDRITPREALVDGGEADVGQLAGQRVTDEDHPSFVSGDEMAAVRDRADLDVGEQVTDGRFGAHSSLARSSGTPIRTCPDPGLRQAAAVLRLARSIAYFDDANW